MWDRFIDLVTYSWIGIFVADRVAPVGEPFGIILLALIPVYVADLGVRYRRVRNLKRFLKEHWLSILMVIPYLRILRIMRLLRLLRIGRVLRTVGAWRRIKRLSSRLGMWWPFTKGPGL